MDDDPSLFLKRFTAAHWPTIARQAWSQYQDRGRGAIVMSLQDTGTSAQQPLRYLTFRGDRDDIAQSSMAMLHQLVMSYDPREEAVVAIVLPDERTVFDVFAKSPSPVDATP